MRNYKKYAITLFICGLMLFGGCAKDNNENTTKENTSIESISTEDSSTEKDTLDEITTSGQEVTTDKSVESKVIDGVYNHIDMEENYVSFDFEMKHKDDKLLGVFYCQCSEVDPYIYLDILEGEELGDNVYKFVGKLGGTYTVTWDGLDTVSIDGFEHKGTYKRGTYDTKENYEKPNFPVYESDMNVEKGIELDATLGKAIRAELGYPDNYVLSTNDLEMVTYLATWDYEITSIKGISYLKNLEEIHFGKNYITDISEMTELLNIRVIELNWGYVKEIPDFSKCEKLDALYLGCNMIKDLTPISKIPNLTYLDVNDNFITSIAPLKDVNTLKTLCIYNNCILDYSSIKDCQSIIDAYDNSQCKFEDALALENRAKEIVASFPKGLSELELEKVIYKYIIDNIYYDDSPRKINAFGYDGIMNGRGVCGDYADAFTLLANYAGFEVYSCISETHAWNIVKIDGTYYHCDALWDEDVYQWNYFNRSTGFMMKIDHHTHDLLRYPICEQSMSVFDYCDVFNELE